MGGAGQHVRKKVYRVNVISISILHKHDAYNNDELLLVKNHGVIIGRVVLSCRCPHGKPRTTFFARLGVRKSFITPILFTIARAHSTHPPPRCSLDRAGGLLLGDIVGWSICLHIHEM